MMFNVCLWINQKSPLHQKMLCHRILNWTVNCHTQHITYIHVNVEWSWWSTALDTIVQESVVAISWDISQVNLGRCWCFMPANSRGGSVSPACSRQPPGDQPSPDRCTGDGNPRTQAYTSSYFNPYPQPSSHCLHSRSAMIHKIWEKIYKFGKKSIKCVYTVINYI